MIPPALTISGVTGKSRVLCLQKRIGILRSYFRIPDGGRSSMVEPQIVVLVVAGSSPVGHPSSLNRCCDRFRLRKRGSARYDHAISSKKNYRSVIFLLQPILRICNFARNVDNAFRHMAIFSTFTITKQLSMGRCLRNVDSASRRKTTQ